MGVIYDGPTALIDLFDRDVGKRGSRRETLGRPFNPWTITSDMIALLYHTSLSWCFPNTAYFPYKLNMHSQHDNDSGEKRQIEQVESENEQIDQDLDRIATVNVDNYHGLNAKTVLVYAVCSSIIL